MSLRVQLGMNVSSVFINALYNESSLLKVLLFHFKIVQILRFI